MIIPLYLGLNKKRITTTCKKRQGLPCLFFSYMSFPVSRVLLKTAIYLGAALPPCSSHLLWGAGPASSPSTVLLRIEFTAALCRQSVGWSLKPPFHPYRFEKRRSISVALVLMSPSAGVTRYPCPVEPGLSSRTAFRLMPATVRLARLHIVIIFSRFVKAYPRKI